MNGEDKWTKVRNLHEVVDYEAMLKVALESAGLQCQARASALEAVSEHSCNIIKDVTDSFNARYADALSFLQSRVADHEGNLRWRKVLWFAFKDDLSKKAWEIAYHEFSQLRGDILRDHNGFLAELVGARNLMMQQGAEAVRSLLGGEETAVKKFISPGLQGSMPDERHDANQSNHGEA